MNYREITVVNEYKEVTVLNELQRNYITKEVTVLDKL